MSDPQPPASLIRRVMRGARAHPLVAASGLAVALYVAIGLCGVLGMLPDPQLRVAAPYQPPGAGLPLMLGTDMFGRSVLYKLLSGTKTALVLGVFVPAIAVPVGTALGALAGYYGGAVDGLVVWLFSVVSALPEILVVIAISFVLGKGLAAIAIATASVGWVSLCRLVRAEFIKHRDREYVLAARLLGARDARLIVIHIAPNALHLCIVSATLQMLAVIKFEVVLTYLGVGIQDGTSWGTMIADAAGELVQGVWWPLAGVVTAMFVLIYALSVLGDTLRDALDPKLARGHGSG